MATLRCSQLTVMPSAAADGWDEAAVLLDEDGADEVETDGAPLHAANRPAIKLNSMTNEPNRFIATLPYILKLEMDHKHDGGSFSAIIADILDKLSSVYFFSQTIISNRMDDGRPGGEPR